MTAPLLASPSLATWREGASLDPGLWLTPTEGWTPAAILSVARKWDGVITPPAAVAVELGSGAWIALGGPIRASR